MALSAGTWLGQYEVLGHLGTGGMGEVYRARDSKLNREVAIKVLPEQFVRDPERIGRFRREAQVLASLDHPNIARIYAFEETGSARYLVMEYVPGDTLRERIKRGPTPVEESLDISKQIAAALEAAHEKTIVHRDLKPANVKITPEGQVKVLDFGLAKAFAEEPPTDPSDSPTLSAMTQPGTILGTAAYMSPEQARGKTVDKRTDIWALGCVMYELLTGKHTFPGEDVTDILGAVLHKEPDWTALPEATPPAVRTLLRRCLQKDAKRRSRDASEIQLQIEETLSAPALEMPAVGKAPPPAPLWRRAMPWAAAVVLSVLVGLGIWQFRPAAGSQPISRLSVQLPLEDRILLTLRSSVAISPDGSHVAYTGAGGGGQLYLRRLDSPEVNPIPGTQVGSNPFFSPDGEWLGFFVSGKLMKVALSGGPSLTLCDACGAAGATWGPDDTIVLSADSGEGRPGLFRVPAAGGMPTVLTQPDSTKGETSHARPEFLPGGNTVLFAVLIGSDFDNAQIEALNLETGERRILVQGGTYPRYAPMGHLVYYRGGTVMAVPFDPDRVEVTGAPAPILEGVMSSLTTAALPTGIGAAQFAFSRTGSLVYVAGLGTDERTLAWVDRNGTVEPLGAPPRAYNRPAISPDGRQVAVRIDGETNDLWI